MITTIASGEYFFTWATDSFAQSTIDDCEMPVPRCGSRTTFTLPASRRASSWSSGCDIESPVTSSVFNGFFGPAAAPTAPGSKASGVTGGTPPAVVTDSDANPPPVEPRSCSGESHPVRWWPIEANGNASPPREVGFPTAWTSVFPTPPPISAPARFTDPPANSTSSPTATKTAISASRAVNVRSPAASNRPSRPSSRTRATSEAEVDEGRHALRGYGGRDEQDQHGERSAEHRRRDALESQPQPVERPRRQELEADHDDDRGDDRCGPQRR